MSHRAQLSTFLVVSMFLATLIRAGLVPPEAPIKLTPPAATIPKELFGMDIHRLASTTPWPDIPFGSFRAWDAYAAWPNLEPQPGKWDFSKTDKYVDLAEQHHISVLFPIALSPAWASSRPEEPSGYGPGNAALPKNMDDWKNYVRTVATRYKGRVHDYEIWNEPNLKQFYTGAAPELVEFARAAYLTLKQVDPSVTVSSPAVTSSYGVPWFDQYLQAGGIRTGDVFGYHVYVNPNPPEEMVPLIQQVRAVMQKHDVGQGQLWDTETGWAIQNAVGDVKPAPGKGFNSVVLSPEQASGYLARAYILNWAAGVSRLYWYAWDDGVMGLVEKDGKTHKAAADAYSQLEKWLIGARMTTCASAANGNWTSEITRDDGYHGWILWNPDHSMEFRVPAGWRVQNMRDLKGGMQKLNKDQSIQIGPTPVLLENVIR